jgi:hypothetical protein
MVLMTLLSLIQLNAFETQSKSPAPDIARARLVDARDFARGFARGRAPPFLGALRMRLAYGIA